jgi:PhzF family phenazine biosynthesis protein
MGGPAISPPAVGEVAVLRVFVHGPGGGNPVPLVADARGMSDDAMRAVASRSGHDSAFVLPATDPRAQWQLRFFVPLHEMEMCGHATVGTLWALRQWGAWTTPRAVVQTLSGLVDARWDDAAGRVWISQPRATVHSLRAEERELVAATLRVPGGASHDIVNASTSRAKTLVRLDSVEQLQVLEPDFAAMEATCTAIRSTGLYPHAFGEPQDGACVVFARQFPRASGYPEDAATGIAAAALWGHLQAAGHVPAGTQEAPQRCVVRQGDAMGRPSAIEVLPRFDAQGRVDGCWLGGRVVFDAT